MKHRNRNMKYFNTLQRLIARGIINFNDDPGNENSGGGNTESWRDSLPSEMQSDAGLQDFSDVGALAKSYLETKSMVGNSIRIPGKDAGDEDRASFTEKLVNSAPNLMVKPDFENPEQSREFYRTVGMPEEATGYTMPSVEGVEFPVERADMLKTMAHEAGISSSQFEKVMTASMQMDVKEAEAIKTAHDEAMTGLKNEWGMAFSDNINKAVVIAQKTGAPEGLLNAIKNNEAGPEVLKWLHDLSGKFGKEGNEIFDQGDNNVTKITPDEARNKINEINGNRAHPYWNPTDPGNKDAVKKMIELQRMANPS